MNVDVTRGSDPSVTHESLHQFNVLRILVKNRPYRMAKSMYPALTRDYLDTCSSQRRIKHYLSNVIRLERAAVASTEDKVFVSTPSRTFPLRQEPFYQDLAKRHGLPTTLRLELGLCFSPPAQRCSSTWENLDWKALLQPTSVGRQTRMLRGWIKKLSIRSRSRDSVLRLRQ